MSQRLALQGGESVRSRPFTKWPVTGPEEIQALTRVLEGEKWGSGMYFGAEEGSEVRRFEARFAEYQQCRYGLAVANGTAALEIILRASGILPGDEVILPDFTFIATATAVLQMGAVPVFADVLPDTFNIDPASVEAAITPRTRAVIGVHWGGQPCDIDALSAICSRHGLTFVEDACQAHGAEWRGRRVGGFGAAGAFSFQGTKNLTCGEGGLITTDDHDLYEMCYGLHAIGRRRGRGPYEHFTAGWNYRLSEFQGALLNEQFGRLEQQTQRRQERVSRFLERLGPESGVEVQKVDPRVSRCSWYIVILRTDSEAFDGIDRNLIAEALRAEGIPAGAPYGHALHANALFQEKNFPLVPDVERLDYSKVHCPVSDQLAVNTIFLPQYIFLGSNEDVDDVVTALCKVRQHAGDLHRSPVKERQAARS
ncbi:MAG TPA: DegT/DnrJ/EryC1/StrS family aminotransferase [Bryobacteraceae bacterium]|nr:DegT/DnrJ/EryC1/StrS family aminotransferase [Bryobacteraceae bacterium]